MKDVDSGFDLVAAFTHFASRGAGWVMWLMTGLGFVLSVLIIERVWLFGRTRVDAPRIGRKLVDCLQAGQLEGARALVARGLAMEERVLADGLGAWERGPRAVEQIMKSSLERERQRFERFLGTLGTV